jgi:hypothetical protein
MQNGLKSLDWEEKSLDSEIEYSKAFKSTPIKFPNFIHLYNSNVSWSGDFNRAVGVKLSGFKSFEEISIQVENIHKAKSLETPDRFDIISPALDEPLWRDHLMQKGYRLQTVIFFRAPSLKGNLESGFSLEIPAPDVYIDWFSHLVQSRGYYNEKWFQKVKPLQLNFSSVFRPYWLKKGNDLVG